MEMGPVEVGERRCSTWAASVEFAPVSVGNPHAVIRREPDREELLRLGPARREPRASPRGRTSSSSGSTGRARSRSASGNAEPGRRLSSGTSAVAAAALRCPRVVREPCQVHLAGGDLLVELDGRERPPRRPGEEICRVELSEEFEL